MIQPIVEGHGEVEAVPVLLRIMGTRMGIPFVPVGRPIRKPRSRLVTQDGIEEAINLAKVQEDCRAILVLFDADDACPLNIAPKIAKWVREASSPLPGGFVLAKREYEAWFLATIAAIAAERGMPNGTEFDGDPETVRDAKGCLEELVGGGFHYDERTDQPSFTHHTCWETVYGRSRSFRKFTKEIHALFTQTGLNPTPWPPRN